MSQEQECPICMEVIEDNCDKTVTKCGHLFHSSCIFQNMAAHNGFGCPYCRTTLAVEAEYSDDDSDYYSDDETVLEQEREDFMLTSFRMFHRQIEGDNNEDEEDEEDDEDDEDEDEEDRREREEEAKFEHKCDYITQYLTTKGISYKQLVKYLLYRNEPVTDVSVVYGQFRAALSRYERTYESDTTNNNMEWELNS
jgi:hypothetical protein